MSPALNPSLPVAADEVDDAHRARLALRRRVADGNGEEGAALPVAAGAGVAVVLLARRQDDGAPLAEHGRGHRAGIVHVDGVRLPVAALHGGQVQLAPVGVVHPEGGAAGAQDAGHLFQDRPRRLFQRDDGAQDLADGVEEGDLLVPLGDLAAEGAHLLVVAGHAGQGGAQEARRARRLVRPARRGSPAAAAPRGRPPPRRRVAASTPSTADPRRRRRAAIRARRPRPGAGRRAPRAPKRAGGER